MSARAHAMCHSVASNAEFKLGSTRGKERKRKKIEKSSFQVFGFALFKNHGFKARSIATNQLYGETDIGQCANDIYIYMYIYTLLIRLMPMH